jgi:predicted phage terminase large subunit-like protein
MSDKSSTLSLNPAAQPAASEPISPNKQKIIDDLNKLTTDELFALQAHANWCAKRHKHQAPPPGGWTVWLMLAGRGAGKTRAAAEWVWFQAFQKPESRWLVCAPTSADIRDTCFEGDSGLISVIPERAIKEYNRSLSEIILKNGSLIKGISAETPDRLRGGQWHGAWCDELAAWQYDQEAWDMIMFALRLGKHPRIVATTTPKPKALIRELIERDGDDVTVVRASTYENIANLAPTFQAQLLKFEGTTLGRQEIHAEVLNPEEQGIIKRNWVKLWPAKKPLPVFEHIVMSLDTAFTESTRDKKTSDADPSACVVLGLFHNEDKPCIMLLDCWEDRLGMPDLIKRVHKEREVYYGDDEQRPLIKPMIGPGRVMGTGRRPDTIVIEDKGSGISLRQMLAREGIIAHAYNPGKASKLTRLHMVSHLFASGMVWFVESEKRKGQVRSWAEPLLYQLCAFSGEGSIRHDDLMDACTQGLRFLADKDMISVSKPKPLQPRLIVNARPRVNPYGV